ncbi:MAG: hypothetical protein ACREU5_03410 [Burkholderiales bacterium]
MAARYLLDANAILNAVFIPSSWSYLAVRLGVENGASLYVGYRSLREAKVTALRLARGLGKRTDPRNQIEAFLRQRGVVQVHPDRSCTVPAGVPRHDEHVFREAYAALAEILTSDHPLWFGCKGSEAAALLPLEVIRRYNGQSLATTIFGVPPRGDVGSIFVRAYPGNWGGMQIPERFSIVDFPGVLWIYYDAAEKQWVAEIEGQLTLRLDAPVTDQSLQTVALSWTAGRLTFRSASAEHPAQAELLKKLGPPTSKSAPIGRHRSEQHYWNGQIYFCVYNDRPIGSDAWREMRRDRDLSPNPFDSDRLLSAMREGFGP